MVRLCLPVQVVSALCEARTASPEAQEKTYTNRHPLSKGNWPSARTHLTLEQSRSDSVIVAVGLKRLEAHGIMSGKVRVAERRLNRTANRALQASLRDAWLLRSVPWAKSPRLPSPPRSARQSGGRLPPKARCSRPCSKQVGMISTLSGNRALRRGDPQTRAPSQNTNENDWFQSRLPLDRLGLRTLVCRVRSCPEQTHRVERR